MCIAFPKAGEGDNGREPGWKSLLLFLPRLLALAWMVVRMLGEAAFEHFRENRSRLL